MLISCLSLPRNDINGIITGLWSTTQKFSIAVALFSTEPTRLTDVYTEHTITSGQSAIANQHVGQVIP